MANKQLKELALRLNIDVDKLEQVKELNNLLTVIQKQLSTATDPVVIKNLQEAAVATTKELQSLGFEVDKVNAASIRAKAGTKVLTDGFDSVKNSAALAGANVIAISQVAADLPFGLKGIANNLTQLSQLFVSLTIQAGGFKNAMTALSGAFKGPLGLIVVINSVIAALQGKQMAQEKANREAKEAAKLTKEQKEALEGVAAANKIFNDELKIQKELQTDINRLTKEQLLQEFSDLPKEIDALKDALKLADQELSRVSEGFNNLDPALLASGVGFENVTKSVQVATNEQARLQGQLKASEERLKALNEVLNPKEKKGPKEKSAEQLLKERLAFFDKIQSAIEDADSREIRSTQKKYDDLIDELKKYGKRYIPQINDLEEEKNRAIARLEEKHKDIVKKAREEVRVFLLNEQEKELDDLAKFYDEQLKKAIEFYGAESAQAIAITKKKNEELNKLRRKQADDADDDADDAEDLLLTEEEKKIKKVIKTFDKATELVAGNSELQAKLVAKKIEKIREIEKKGNENAEGDLKDSTELRLELVGSLLGGIADLYATFDTGDEERNKRNFERGKVFAIAETIISTILSAQKSYQALSGVGPAGPVLGAIAAAAATASGLARIAQIKNTEYKSKTPPKDVSSSKSTPDKFGAGQTGFSAVTPVVPGQGIPGQGKIKVFVTQSDIRDAMDKEDSRNRRVQIVK